MELCVFKRDYFCFFLFLEDLAKVIFASRRKRQRLSLIEPCNFREKRRLADFSEKVLTAKVGLLIQLRHNTPFYKLLNFI